MVFSPSFFYYLMQAALKQATEELQETQRVLEEAKARLADVEEGIASLQAKYEECIAKKQELEFKTEQCSARLGRAEKVGAENIDKRQVLFISCLKKSSVTK